MGYYYMVSYGITFLALIITVGAQFFINSSYKKYLKVKTNISGQEAAKKILEANGLDNIYVVETKGTLTDHYDPTRKVIKLSTDVFHNESVASVAVAAHECGHAIQDKENYKFLRIRAALVPFVNFSSYAGYIAIVLGIIFGSLDLIWIGIALEIVILVFQLITLPVEIDASKRALKQIEKLNLLSEKNISGCKNVLTAAAMTYVASLATTILQILRLVLLYGNRQD